MPFALVLLALTASPKVLAPVASLTVSDRELHTFTTCGESIVLSAGDQLISGSLDVTKKTFAPLRTEPLSAWAMAFTPTCDFVLLGQTAGEGPTRVNDAAVRQLKKPGVVSQIGTFALPVASIAIDPTGRFFALATNGGDLAIHSLDAKGQTKRVFEAPRLPKGDQVLHLQFGKTHLVGGTYKGSVFAWPFDPALGTLGQPLNLMAPTGPTRETGSLGVTSGDIVMPGGARVLDLTLSNGGTRAWAAVESGSIFSWDLTSPSPTRSTVVEGLKGAGHVAVSADGALLAASGNFTAQLFKVSGTTATLVGELGNVMHIDQYVLVRQLRFVGKRLVLGTGDLSVGKLLIYQP